MQPTTRFHHGITNALLQEADVVLHPPVAFHPTHGVLNTEADGGTTTIGRFLRRGELSSTRCFLRLEDRDARQEKSLEALRLIQATAGGQGVACPLGHALSRGFPFRGGAQAAKVPGLIDHEAVFARGAFFLPTVILLLLLRVFRTLDWSFGPLMKSREEGAEAAVGGVVGCPGRKPLVVRQGLIPHRMQQMQPRVRRRWRHPQELSLPLLERMLLHVSQAEEPLGGRRWERTGGRRTRAAARAGLPLNRAVMPGGHQRRLDMGQQSLTFGLRESGSAIVNSRYAG
jgi:hypothetical protein